MKKGERGPTHVKQIPRPNSTALIAANDAGLCETKTRPTTVHTVIVSCERVEHLACCGVHQPNVGIERRHEEGLTVLGGYDRCDGVCGGGRSSGVVLQ